MIGKTKYACTALLALGLAAALISGCQGATQIPAATSTVAVPAPPDPTLAAKKAPEQPTTYPAPEIAPGTPEAQAGAEATGYPAPGSQAGGTPAATPVGEGGYPPPAGSPAVDNRSKVVAELLEQKAGESADEVILHVKVISSEAIPGMQEFTSKLVDKEADLIAVKADLPDLKAGDKFAAEVTFKGDEAGGKYFATKVAKQ